MLGFSDEPICTATWFAHWLVMEEVAGRGFPVILNGHVGDELFAGYWDHYMYNLIDLARTRLPSGYRGRADRLAGAARPRSGRVRPHACARVTALERRQTGPSRLADALRRGRRRRRAGGGRRPGAS